MNRILCIAAVLCLYNDLHLHKMPLQYLHKITKTGSYKYLRPFIQRISASVQNPLYVPEQKTLTHS